MRCYSRPPSVSEASGNTALMAGAVGVGVCGFLVCVDGKAMLGLDFALLCAEICWCYVYCSLCAEASPTVTFSE